MVLKIKDNQILSDSGEVLKQIACPLKVAVDQLDRVSQRELVCRKCDKSIIDTNQISENELVAILVEDRETCLKISRFNPIFEFVK